MQQCTIKFHSKSDDRFDDRQSEPQSSVSNEDNLKSCFITITNYLLSFFDSVESVKPFYELNIGEYNIDAKSELGSVTLNHKKANHPLLTINADDSVLFSIQNMSQTYSSDKGHWNLLMDTPYHIQKDSYLTQNGKNSNARGLIALITIIAVFSQIRDVINNHLTYGLLPMPELGQVEQMLAVYAVTCFIGTLAVMASIEKLAFKNVISNNLAAFLEAVNISQVFALPIYFVKTYKPDICMASLYITLVAGVVLKIISYTHLMHDVRRILPRILTEKMPEESLKFEISSENLSVIFSHVKNPSTLVNIKDIFYFFFAPTAVYQLWYPRSKQVNKKRAFRLFAEVISILIFMQYYINQHLIPLVKSTTEAYLNGTMIEMLDQILYTVPKYTIMMLLSAFFYFHAVPNFLAEILRFGNRDFYKAFWNCDSIKDYWNHWNLPVHKWCVRHVYNPIQKRGYSPCISTFGVFVFSGIMHEYMMGGPVAMASVTFTAIMFLQAVLIFVQDRFNKRFGKIHIANAYMWLQCPIAFMLALIAYRVKYLAATEEINIIAV